MTMQRDSILYDQYASKPNQSIRNSEQISPIHALIAPRFSSLLARAADHRERVSAPTWVHSPSTITVNSNPWSPAETSNEKLVKAEKKSCLSPAWKSRLQGLLVGLAIAAISIGIILGVLLTRPSANSTTPATTATTVPSCDSLQWSSSGVTVAGNGTYGSASNELRNPWGIYVDSNNIIYVADSNNHRVQQWLPNAVSGTTVAGITGVSGSNGSLLNSPVAVYGDSQQNLYVADNNGISVWSLGASVGTRISGSTSLTPIYALYVDGNGNLYASSYFYCALWMWTPTATAGTLVAGGAGCGYSSSQLFYPYGFTVDSLTNTIYVANENAHTIVAWSVGATVGTIIAGWNNTYGTADFLLDSPLDVKRDQYGNLYVADRNNNRVLLFCQNPPTMHARIIAGYQVFSPISIALDSDLNLYLSEPNYYRVQKYTRIV